MLLPAMTGSGLSELVTDRSALAPTAMMELAVLFPTLGSGVAELIAAVSVIKVPDAVLAFTFTVSTNVAVAALFKVAMLQVIAPLAPTAGVVQDHPTGT